MNGEEGFLAKERGEINRIRKKWAKLASDYSLCFYWLLLIKKCRL